MKGSDERGHDEEEEEMKLISNHELHQQSESELSALFRTVSEALVRCPRLKISLGCFRSIASCADHPSAETHSPRWKTSASKGLIEFLGLWPRAERMSICPP